MRYRRQDHTEITKEITRLKWLIDKMAAAYILQGALDALAHL